MEQEKVTLVVEVPKLAESYVARTIQLSLLIAERKAAYYAMIFRFAHKHEEGKKARVLLWIMLAFVAGITLATLYFRLQMGLDDWVHTMQLEELERYRESMRQSSENTSNGSV